MWRDVIFALYGSVKLAACNPTVTCPVVVLDGVVIAELVPMTTMRMSSAWLGDGELPNFLSKGSFERGGPLTRRATQECGFGGLTEFPVINLGATLFDQVFYCGSPCSFYGACMDLMFYYDYGLRDVGGSIGRWYDSIERLASAYKPSGSCKCAYYFYERGRCALIIYHGLNFKRSLEDSLRANNVRSRALAIKWIDKRLMMEIAYFDGGSIGTIIDSGLSRTNRWDSGISKLMNDFVDFGFDVSCSEMGNMVFSVSDGNVTEDSIALAYRHMCHALNSMFQTRQMGPIGTMVTALWQLANYRHKTMEFMTISASDGVEYHPCTASNFPENCFVNSTCQLDDGLNPDVVDVDVTQDVRLHLDVDNVKCTKEWVNCIECAKEYSWSRDLKVVVMSYKILLKAAKQGLVKRAKAEAVFSEVADKCCAALTYMCRDADWRINDAMWRAILELYCFDGIGFYACRGSMVVIKERVVGDEREGLLYSSRPFE